jgi:hypothetical protein
MPLLVLAACGGGDLTTEQLSAVVEKEQPTLKVCYDEALAKHPLKDEVRMEAMLSITPGGKVDSVELDPPPPLPGLSTCLHDAIGRWRFPQAEKATSTSLPLIFRPEVVHKPID